MTSGAAKNAFALSFLVDDLKEAVSNLLKSKHYSKFDLIEISLSYVPYYVFHYTAYRESLEGGAKEDEEDDSEESKGGNGAGEGGFSSGGEPVVSDINHGTFALQGTSGELEIELGESLEDADELTSFEKGSDGVFEVEVKKPILSLVEAEKLSVLKTAKELGLPKKNVEVSEVRLVYVPVWVVSVSVAGDDFELSYSGLDGELLGADDIPERQRGKGELASETVNELTSPAKWGEYFSNLIRDFYESEQLRNVGKFLLYDWRGRLILALVVLYLVFRLLGFSWP